MEEKVILVDEDDNETGTGEKLETHQSGRLHRAFSIFIFNATGELLLQKRAKIKYHSGGLWSNACCGHPRPNEDIGKAARRRLKEEMGFAVPLKKAFAFRYKVRLEGEMIENEYDHVFCGIFDGKPKPNSREAEDWKWIDLSDLQKDLKDNPETFTHWFRIAAKRLKELEKHLIF